MSTKVSNVKYGVFTACCLLRHFTQLNHSLFTCDKVTHVNGSV